MEVKSTSTISTNDEPNPPIWSDTVKIFRPPGDCATSRNWIQQELYKSQDHEIACRCDDTMPQQQQQQQRFFTCDDHFSRRRMALLFAPGIYPNIHFEIGYYVQVLGLGEHVHDVQFRLINDCGDDNNKHLKVPQLSRFIGPYIPALNKHIHKRADHGNQHVGTSLDSFWRGAENFTITANAMGTTTPKTLNVESVAKPADMLWAASQAASIRRLHITGDLYLHDRDAYASGGHLANVRVDGTIFMGGQQQYLVRNVHIGTNATGGAWSMVYVGCTGNVPNAGKTISSGDLVVTVVDKPRVRIEKPYIVMKKGTNDKEELFELRVPQVKYSNDSAYSIDPALESRSDEVILDFARIRVVRDTEPITRIQEALDDGKHVILCPGIYTLQETIVIRHPNQILFGLGLATLVAPKDATPCIYVVHNTPGVRLAGLMLEANGTDINAGTEEREVAKQTSALLVWGDNNKQKIDSNDAENRKNPGAAFDIYIRVGGAASTKNVKTDRTRIVVNTMMCIHSDCVIGDNLWLWRADHAELDNHEECNYPNISPIFWQTESDEFRVQHGLVVTGNDVTIFGLAVEHTNSHPTIWSGERGAVYFYQCELPYDTITTKDGTNDRCDCFGHSRYGKTIDICGFYIHPNVQEHTLYAPGIYSNFRNEEIYAATGTVHPHHPLVEVINPFIVKLDNLGGIKSVVNGKGEGTERQGIPVRFDV